MADSGQEEGSTNELASSKLGTKDFWEENYKREYANYKDTGDIEETWFGKESIDRILDWIEETDHVKTDDSFLDLGCGNGFTLLQLGENGFHDLSGVDYSPKAIELARDIAAENDVEIHFEVGDLLTELPPKESGALLSKTYNVCFDKGTYDAISLNPVNPTKQRNAYITNVHSLLAGKGLLILTSCNWTESELVVHFREKFKVVDRVAAPTFEFGGVQGSRESVIIFKAF